MQKKERMYPLSHEPLWLVVKHVFLACGDRNWSYGVTSEAQ